MNKLRMGFLSVALLGALSLTACEMSAPPNNGGGDNGGSDNGGSDNGGQDNGDDGSADGMSQLTLRIVGPVGGEFARVYGIIDAGPLVHDDLVGRFPQSDFNVTLQSSSSDGITERVFAYPNGTQVALVAVESDGFLTATPPPDVIETFPNQFATWSGDVTADAGNSPAALYFVLNGDRTITAEYKPMHAMFIESNGGGPQSSVLIEVDVDRYIIGDEEIAVTGVGTSDNVEQHVVWGYHRETAKITLEVNDYIDNGVATCAGQIEGPCFVFESWSGDCSGSGKTCVVELFDEHRSTVNLEDING